MSLDSYRIRLSAVVVAGLLVACAHGDEPQGPVVKDLEIVGNEEVEAGDIKDQILTAETSWIPFFPKKRLDRNVWSTDLRRIERYYQARGYFQAEVVDDEVKPLGDDTVALQVRVTEGEPTRIQRVSLEGLQTLPKPHQKAVRAVVALSEGEIFRESEWEGLKEKIQTELVNLGYAEAEVTGNAKVDLATQQAFIDLQIDPGLRYHPGDVQVTVQPGARVEAWRVEEQVREAIEDEEWYSQEVRQEAQQRVFNLGVFGAAQVEPGQGDPTTGRIPLHVEVTEAPFHEVAVGVGLGIEQRRQEGHVLGEYTHRDFLGGLRRLTLDLRAGWAWLPSFYTVASGGDAVTRHGPVARLGAELHQPRLFHPNLQLRTRVEAERALEEAYQYTGGRVHLGVPYRPWSWLTIEPSYNFEVYALSAGEATLTSDAPALLFGCESTCILSYLEQTFVFDRRDDPQEPREGYYLGMALQEGGKFLGGSFDYLRIIPEVRAYKSFLFAKRLTFAGRVRVGTLIPLGGADDLETPIVARFFSGGDEMRGFSARRLAPMRLVEKTNPEGEYDAEPMPIGGNGLFSGSAEARYELRKGLILATFVDTGFVTTEDVQFNRPSYFTDNLLWAVGVGARYITPVGPVRLDLAYRLPFGPPLRVYDAPNADLNYLPSQGCFGFGQTSDSYGGAPEGVCALHLSIGEAF